MPRKRNTKQFRRGSEQKYHKMKVVYAPSSSIGESSLHLPNWLVMAMIFSLGVMLSATVLRTNVVSNLAKTDMTKLIPQVQMPKIEIPAVHMPQLSIPNISISVPKVSLPAFSIPEITVPQLPQVQNPIPKIDGKPIHIPKIHINLSPIQEAGKIAATTIVQMAAFILKTFNPLPALRMIGEFLQIVGTTIVSWLITIIQRLDPRPFFPAIRGGLIQTGVFFLRSLIAIARFVNPIPFLRSAWAIQIQALRQSMTIIAMIASYAWQATVSGFRFLQFITVTVQVALWKTSVTVSNVIRISAVAVFQLIRWVVMGIYNIFTAIVRTIIAFIKSVSAAVREMTTAVAHFFRPYLLLISGGFNNGTSYLQKSSEQTKEIMGGMMNQYSENTGEQTKQ